VTWILSYFTDTVGWTPWSAAGPLAGLLTLAQGFGVGSRRPARGPAADRGVHPTISCLLLLFLLFTSCGYHVAGKADLLPRNIKTIAIPAFGNGTHNAKLSERVTSALTREFISRTRYRIVADPNQAEAVLTGAVTNILSYPTTLDTLTGRASGAQIIVYLQVTLTDRSTGRVLFTRPLFEVRERYEISVNAATYFEESDSALERLSRDVARSVVSAVLENF
jgi:hypothetical protein